MAAAVEEEGPEEELEEELEEEVVDPWPLPPPPLESLEAAEDRVLLPV